MGPLGKTVNGSVNQLKQRRCRATLGVKAWECLVIGGLADLAALKHGFHGKVKMKITDLLVKAAEQELACESYVTEFTKVGIVSLVKGGVPFEKAGSTDRRGLRYGP